MDITEEGMVMDVNWLQKPKVIASIFLIDGERVTDVRALQPLKADPPMSVTEDGRVIDVNPA